MWRSLLRPDSSYLNGTGAYFPLLSPLLKSRCGWNILRASTHCTGPSIRPLTCVCTCSTILRVCTLKGLQKYRGKASKPAELHKKFSTYRVLWSPPALSSTWNVVAGLLKPFTQLGMCSFCLVSHGSHELLPWLRLLHHRPRVLIGEWLFATNTVNHLSINLVLPSFLWSRILIGAIHNALSNQSPCQKTLSHRTGFFPLVF